MAFRGLCIALRDRLLALKGLVVAFRGQCEAFRGEHVPLKGSLDTLRGEHVALGGRHLAPEGKHVAPEGGHVALKVGLEMWKGRRTRPQGGRLRERRLYLARQQRKRPCQVRYPAKNCERLDMQAVWKLRDRFFSPGRGAA